MQPDVTLNMASSPNESFSLPIVLAWSESRANGVVEEASSIVQERDVANALFSEPSALLTSALRSNRCVLVARGIEQKRYSANCGIGTAVVEDQRASAYSGIKAAVGIGEERTPTKACISRTGGEGQ